MKRVHYGWRVEHLRETSALIRAYRCSQLCGRETDMIRELKKSSSIFKSSWHVIWNETSWCVSSLQTWISSACRSIWHTQTHTLTVLVLNTPAPTHMILISEMKNYCSVFWKGKKNKPVRPFLGKRMKLLLTIWITNSALYTELCSWPHASEISAHSKPFKQHRSMNVSSQQPCFHHV